MLNNFKNLLLITLLILTSSNVFAINYSLVKKNTSDLKMHEISYNYEWMSGSDIPSNMKRLVGITLDNEDAEIIRARFVFYVKGDYKNFNNNFYSNVKNLNALSGMTFTQINDIDYDVSGSSYGVDITAKASEYFDLEYDYYKQVFNYKENKKQSSLIHQVTTDFSKTLFRTDIISHITQAGEFVKITIDSFAILDNESSESFFSSVIKNFIVSSMKSQIRKVPAVYKN